MDFGDSQIILFSIASVSAADMNETATTSSDEYESELSQNDETEIIGQNENSKVKSGNAGNFSELQDSINNNYVNK